jgi:NAD(P)-dependent dehydrogenase (short-subunit alcohol dehydrogenase family)
MDARRFDRTTTAQDVLAGLDLGGRVILVTGASSGLGAESARALAARGAALILTGRDVAKTEAVAHSIRTARPDARVEVGELHLERPESVRAFAKELLARHRRLDVVLANAGVMACPLTRTAEGFELQLATNHLGHFLLTGLLAPALLAAAPSRVVAVSSAGHSFSPVVFQDLHFETRPYDKWQAYGQSKTANILFAVELERRFGARGVHAFALHPGMIVTELGRHMTPEDIPLMQERARQRAARGLSSRKSIPEGAATQLWAATAPELEGRGGLYLEDCQVSGVEPPPGSIGCQSYALDPEAAQRLWSVSETLLGQRFDA